MLVPDLDAVWDSLQHSRDNPLDSGQITAQVILDYENYRLGRDDRGNPCLLVATPDVSGDFANPIVLEHLTVIHTARCRVFTPADQIEEATFTLLKCLNGDSNLISYFLKVCSLMISTLGPNPSTLQIKDTVAKLISLFSALTRPAKNSVQGLWAELFMICQSRNPETLVGAWHVNPEDCFDFNCGWERIEVKSTSLRTRRHTFNLAQLQPPSGCSILIASILMQRSGGGVSIIDLVDRLMQRKSLYAERLRIEQLIGLTLGESWRTAADERYDEQSARQSLCYYHSFDVPSVDPTLPIGVSNVTFDSDLSSIPVADLRQYRDRGTLFSSIRSR